MNLYKILKKSQADLKRALHTRLKQLGYAPVSRRGFLYAPGKLPVLLVAHLDTVHRELPSCICTSADGDILMAPEGIGGDDRAGVYMILQLLKRHRCHVLFCEDEEIGGVGASLFTRSKISPKINYIVELDRRGANDAVFYSCDNPEFTEFVCSFGFKENIGSFSDISILAPYLGVAAVNISAGYHNEHTAHEYISVSQMRRNIGLLSRMLETPTDRFPYVESHFLWDSCSVSPLPSGAYLVDEAGEMFEAFPGLYIDRWGGLYESLADGRVSECLGLTAYTAQSLPARYDPDNAFRVTVVG